jgi:murein DD-endopeptidase MepM/ murein hydrolase activator NlpD
MENHLFPSLCPLGMSRARCLRRLAAVGIAGFVSIAGLAGYTGFAVGQQRVAEVQVEALSRELRAELAAEKRLVEEARRENRQHLDAMALRIASLQAHLMRIDALGGRLVEIGELDEDEFDFSVPPPAGGIDDAVADGHQSAGELGQQMQRLAALLDDRERKLDTLEFRLMSLGLKAEVTPSGKPVAKGWLSSNFGRRTDPFTGKKSYHRGIDFAGKPGSDVIAVASGIVTRSKYASGYGNVVEIRHADGYTTLYGHNQENLVREGEVVSKGQTIALLGSTGRSSGPHVHFEVHRNDKIVNPLKYVQ